MKGCSIYMTKKKFKIITEYQSESGVYRIHGNQYIFFQ